MEKENEKGKVYLVGAGPGDYRLLTNRGMELLQEADIVFFDRLVNPALLSFIPDTVEKIYVGKARGDHSYTQEEINEVLVERANRGKVVVRLKGGDPFVFGRGGEEALTFRKAGIDFEIVPGITSVIAAAAYAGIPVTHRGLSSSFHVFTGHQPEKLNFPVIARISGTLIFVMGLKNLAVITEELIANGQPGDKRVAVIHYGTTSEQQVIRGSLQDIVARVEAEGITPPVLTVIGDVVGLEEELSWFKTGPLAGRRIMVTRPRGQQLEMGRMIEKLGGEPFYYPTIEIRGPIVNDTVKKSINSIEEYDWIMFTSVNGVKNFFSIMNEMSLDIRRLVEIKFAVIGPATGDALQEYGIFPDFVPGKYTTSSLTQEFLARIDNEEDYDGNAKLSIFLPRADIANKQVEIDLKAAGHQVNNISVYQTVKPDTDGEQLITHLAERGLDMITFTSSSTVRYLLHILEDRIEELKEIPVACIGPVTAETAREAGLWVEATAEEYTIDGLVTALRDYLSEK